MDETTAKALHGWAVAQEKIASGSYDLILLDEFESFAANRGSAHRNWEVSQVNELLTQLEHYSGRVIACTNIVDYLDPAIRRRFHLKVEILPLTVEQRCRLFSEFSRRLGLKKRRGVAPEFWVGALDGLCYGHFANAARVASNLSDLNLERFAELLAQELESTNGKRANPIGFAA